MVLTAGMMLRRTIPRYSAGVAGSEGTKFHSTAEGAPGHLSVQVGFLVKGHRNKHQVDQNEASGEFMDEERTDGLEESQGWVLGKKGTSSSSSYISTCGALGVVLFKGLICNYI